MKIIITAAIASLVTAGLIGGLWIRSKATAMIEQATKVRLEKPSRGELVEVVSAPGETQPVARVSISARVSARIIELPCKEGQCVTKGDGQSAASVLVRLDDKDLQSNLRSAQARRDAQAAQLQVAKMRLATQESAMVGTRALLDDARRTLERDQELARSHTIAQSELDQAQCSVDKLQADLEAAENSLKADRMALEVLQHQLASAEAEVARCKDDLANTMIVSPIDGTVTRLAAEVGELAVMGTMNNPGTEILRVADLSRMLLVAQIDEADIGAVEPGQNAKIRIQAYGEKVFSGKVQSVALINSISGINRSKCYETKILIDTQGQQIFSGLTAEVEIQTKRHDNVLRLPSQAVLGRRVDDLPWQIRDKNPTIDQAKSITPVVYRCVNGKAVVTPVKIGAANATQTIILEGLNDDDVVVVGPYKVLEQLRHEQKLEDEKASATASTASTASAATSSAPATVDSGQHR